MFVPLRGIDLHRDERVAELASEGVEACARHHGVAGEAKPHDARTLRGAFLDPNEVGVTDTRRAAARGRDSERQRRLAEDRSEHRVVDHHAEGEPAGETHPDRTDPGTAALRVCFGGEAAEPTDHGARPVERERRELLGDAPLGERCERVPDTERPAGCAEQGRHAHAEPGVDDALGELHDLGDETGHLVDHDHRRTGAAAEHGPAHAVVRELRFGEPGEYVAHVVRHYGFTVRRARPTVEEHP